MPRLSADHLNCQPAEPRDRRFEFRAPAAAGQPAAKPARQRPMRFAEAILFQFVNPKVWTMAVTAALVNTPCIALWAACGKVLRRRRDDARTRRLFDGFMALLVIGTAIWILRPVSA